VNFFVLSCVCVCVCVVLWTLVAEIMVKRPDVGVILCRLYNRVHQSRDPGAVAAKVCTLAPKFVGPH